MLVQFTRIAMVEPKALTKVLETIELVPLASFVGKRVLLRSLSSKFESERGKLP